MLTKYILTIGSTEYEIPDECLKNWDEIAFSLKRTDYSGVMRSFSTEFVFVGEIKDLLWQAYLADGFKASASVAVYTITDRHEWVEKFSSPLDFSTIEISDEALTINALDNALASQLKAKKSQKYEYSVGDFSTTSVNVARMELANYAGWSFPVSSTPYVAPDTYMTALLNERTSQIISNEYIEPCDEIWNYDGPDNRFFATVKKSGLNASLKLTGYVRCRLCPYMKETLDAMKAEALRRFGSYGHITNEYNGIFGIVGMVSDYGSTSYWQQNTVYEFQNGSWINKGTPEDYYQDRNISDGIRGYNGLATIPLPEGNNGAVLCLKLSGGGFYMQYASMTLNWSDPVRTTLTCRGISPLELITKVVRSITDEQTVVSIAEDDAGLIAKTLLIAGEDLRQINDAKIYTTFGNFVDWMEAVFGYTYRMVGDTLEFVHRSAVFEANVVKTIENYRDVSYAVVDDLIYSQVEAGYPKKEYGEIDGRLETNFTNYYTTGYTLTDKKLSLQSKYRADRYGVEFTARKSESDTKDDKADEDVFFIRFVTNSSSGVNNYQPSYQSAFAPSVCVDNNKAFIAALGNGDEVTLTMTSSDGNNGLSNITIPADTALFTAGELEFTTEQRLPHQRFHQGGRVPFRPSKRSGIQTNSSRDN